MTKALAFALAFLSLNLPHPDAGVCEAKPKPAKLTYPVLQGRDHDEVLDAYAPIPSIPTNVVIGRDGTICSQHVGIVPVDVFEKEIKALLGSRS